MIIMMILHIETFFQKNYTIIKSKWINNLAYAIIRIYRTRKRYILTTVHMTLWLTYWTVICSNSSCTFTFIFRQMTFELWGKYKHSSPWCNRYRRRKWTRRHEFNSWTRLIAFHIALIPLGKLWIQLFSLQLWINSRADWFLQPWWGN